jgi:hypothetical protein
MAIVVNGGAAFNITSELAATQDLTVTGLSIYADPGNAYVSAYVKVWGTTVLSLTVEPTTSTHTFYNLDFNSVKTAIYNAASGHSLTGGITVEVVNRSLIPVVSDTGLTASAGSLTLKGRLTTVTNWVTSPTTAAPWNLAVNTFKLVTAWTRPHIAFYARVRVSVWNGSSYVIVYNHTGWPTNTNTSFSTAEFNAAVAAMGGVSPRKVKVELVHQFLTSTIATDISGATAIVKEVIDGAVKSFYAGSRVGIYDGADWVDHEAYIYDGSSWILQQIYAYNGSAWVESL